jgi:cytochrome c oxidase subunit 2
MGYMAKGLFLALFSLAVLEGIAWFVYTNSQKKDVKLKETTQQAEQSKQNASLSPSQAVKNSAKDTALQEIRNNGQNVERKKTTESIVTAREFDMIGRQFSWEPSTIKVKQGDRVKLHIKSEDVLHGIVIPELGIDNTDIPVGETRTVEFTASKKGRFEFLCSTFCGDRHIDMTGVIVVE